MKFYYFVVILIGIITLLNIAGIETSSGSLARTLNIIGNSTMDVNRNSTLENFKDSSPWGGTDGISPLLAGLLAGGVIIIGLFITSRDIRYLIAPITLLFAGLIVADIIDIYNLLNSYGISWIKWSATLILGSLLGGFIITTIQFFLGGDN